MLIRLRVNTRPDLYHLYVAAGVVEVENTYNYLAFLAFLAFLAYLFSIRILYS